jgi:hypothetical protein
MASPAFEEAFEAPERAMVAPNNRGLCSETNKTKTSFNRITNLEEIPCFAIEAYTTSTSTSETSSAGGPSLHAAMRSTMP